MRSVWRFLTSPRPGFALAGAVLAVSAFASFLRPEIADEKVHRAKWFAGLLAAMSTAVVLSAVKRLVTLSVRTLGLLVAHVGALLLATGAWIDFRSGAHGSIDAPVTPGEVYDGYRLRGGRTVEKLPFQYSLETFSVELHPPRLWVLERTRDEGLRKEQYAVRQGSRVSSRGYVFTVEETFGTLRTVEEAREASAKPPHAAALVRLRDARGAVVRETWLGGAGAGAASVLVPPEESSSPRGFRLSYLGCGPEEPPDLEAPVPDGPRLFVRLRDAGVTRVLPAVAGAAVFVSDRYSLRVESTTFDFQRRAESDEVLAPVDPAACVVIAGPSGDEQRWVFANHDDHGHGQKYPEVGMTYLFPEGGPPVEARLFTMRDGEVYRHEVYLPATRTRVVLALDRPVPLHPSGHAMELVRFLPDAVVSRREVDAGSRLERPAPRVRMGGPEGGEPVTLVVGEPHLLKGRDFFLVYAYRDGFEGDIREFESRMRIVEGGEARPETISVNRPLSIGEFRIHQDVSKEPESGKWQSTFRVVKEPGARLETAGILVLAAGLFLSVATLFLAGRPS